MTEQPQAKPSSATVADAGGKPMTMKDRVVGCITALVMIGFGVAMCIRPDVAIDPSDQSGRRGRLIAWVLDLIWSRPAGVILGLLGLLVLLGALTRKNSQKQATP